MRLAMTIGCMFASVLAQAQVTVSEPWIRATVGGQKVAGGYLQIKSERDTALVGVKSPAAANVEVHEMAMVDNVMRMRALQKLDVPAGRSVELKPGGYHLMLIDIKEPMKVGAKVPLQLTFEDKDKKRETVEVTAEVRPLSGASAAKGEHKHH
ncbi:MAG: copper chaperone PCu(A)C [Betaproteobacteria bacterium]|nr:copper chaperone PCu(A)C [Betaproteobacteria bacterium]